MKMTLKPLSEQVIVVTGATSGNGLAIVERAADQGAAIVAVARNEVALEALRERLTGHGARIAICQADVSDPAAVERVAEVAVAAFGGFDSWINNAAVGTYGALEQVPLADHRRVFDVNYFGLLHGCLVAARHLRGRGGGAIINVGSILSDRAIVEQGPYCASKHAVQALTETVRMELAREASGISVTLVKPGAIDTPFADHARNFMDEPPRLPQPLYRPEIVADAALFACAHPRRTVYAGGGGLLTVLLSRASPLLTDFAMQAAGKWAQQEPGEPGDPARRDNLYEPRADALRGSQKLSARHTSLAVQVQKVPPAVIGLSLLAGGAAMMFARAQQRRSQSLDPRQSPRAVEQPVRA
nr:short chain dehydrogenase [uncultured organism]